MEPINKKERDSLFWQFVVLFTAAVALFVLVLHFDFRLPVRLSELQRQKLGDYERFASNQQRIAESIEKMESQIGMITATSDMSGPDRRVNEELSHFKMEFMGVDTSVSSYRLMRSIYSAMDKHRASQLSAAKSADGLNRCRDEKERIDRELTNTKRELYMYKGGR